jgi:hypothetical protein
MSNRLQHALHNERASKHLKTKAEFTDWVVTTTFYSAVHFIEHFVFPFDHEENGVTHKLKSIADYQRLRKSAKSKHELRHDLVIWKCPDLEVAFKWLYDTCYNARYFDYELPNPNMAAQIADGYLNKIKVHCEKKK